MTVMKSVIIKLECWGIKPFNFFVLTLVLLRLHSAKKSIRVTGSSILPDTPCDFKLFRFIVRAVQPLCPKQLNVQGLTLLPIVQLMIY
jgi:hypothetical protein